MNPGELNKRVTLQRRGNDKDSSGAMVQGGTWVNVVDSGDGKVWARVRDMTGRQFIAADATQNAVTTEIRIRIRAGLQAKMRVLFRQDIYDIEAVLERDGRWLDLMCTKGLSNG
jgi:SPP1 family predicted phage head-tail adaptor